MELACCHKLVHSLWLNFIVELGEAVLAVEFELGEVVVLGDWALGEAGLFAVLGGVGLFCATANVALKARILTDDNAVSFMT